MKIQIKVAIGLVMVGLLSCGKVTQETSVIRKDVTEAVFASGTLEAEGSYNLTAQADGYLKEVLFNEGDIVASGAILAIIDNKQNDFSSKSSIELLDLARINVSSKSPALSQAINTSSLAKQRMELDSTLFSKYKVLFESNSVSALEYENSRLQFYTSKANYINSVENYEVLKQQAEQSLITNESQKEISQVVVANNTITTVFEGKVYRKFKNKGDYVRKGDVIATIGDSKFMYAKVNIDEGNIEKVKVGQEAIVKLNVNKTKTYKGTVSEVYPSFDESTQSFTCKILLREPLQFSILKTQLQANIIVDNTKNAMLIPANFIDFGGKVELKGRKEKIEVVTKFRSTQWVQVVSGINDEDILVTDNLKVNQTATSETGSQMH